MWCIAGPGGSVAGVTPVREKVGKMKQVRDSARTLQNNKEYLFYSKINISH